MSREIKRVPMDFDAPLNKVWTGYLMGDELRLAPCLDCHASGITHFGWWLNKMSYVMGMLALDVRDQERGKPMHPWLKDFPHPHGHFDYPVPFDPKSGYGPFVIDRPGPDALEFFSKLAELNDDVHRPGEIGTTFGPDVHYSVIRALLNLTGIDIDCKVCDGTGGHEKYPGQRAERDAWERTEPPEGDGWQMWSTVSDGTPVTPVFATAEELAEHISLGNGMVGRMEWPYEHALAFVKEGWAPSGINGEDGVRFIGRAAAEGAE